MSSTFKSFCCSQNILKFWQRCILLISWINTCFANICTFFVTKTNFFSEQFDALQIFFRTNFRISSMKNRQSLLFGKLFENCRLALRFSYNYLGSNCTSSCFQTLFILVQSSIFFWCFGRLEVGIARDRGNWKHIELLVFLIYTKKSIINWSFLEK